MSSQKRPATALGSILAKSAKEAKRTAEDRPSTSANNNTQQGNNNPFLSRPTQPEEAIKLFLIQSRSMARRKGGAAAPTNFEIEARLGTILSPYGQHDMRALSSGPKLVPIKGMNRVVHALIAANTIASNFESSHVQVQNAGVWQLEKTEAG